jgi:hypothetical protein
MPSKSLPEKGFLCEGIQDGRSGRASCTPGYGAFPAEEYEQEEKRYVLHPLTSHTITG